MVESSPFRGDGEEPRAAAGPFKRSLEPVAAWLRPAVFLGHNPWTLLGAVLTTGSGVPLVVFWIHEFFFGGAVHPYIGIILFLILPSIFVTGLVLMPAGALWRRRKLRKAGELPPAYPQIDFRQPLLRRAAGLVAGASLANALILGMASYRSVEYMDSVQFCGESCHTVMAPEFTAYKNSPHARVACVDCHIGPGAPWFVRSKLSGVRQVFAVTFKTYSRPIPDPVRVLRPARETCEQCHWPEKFSGDKLVVRTRFGDDDKNQEVKTVLLVHVGGAGADGKLVGIHGRHLGLITYISTDNRRQVIPWVQYRGRDGRATEFVSGEANLTPAQLAQGERRSMDCMDCHNRPTHRFELPEGAVNRAMEAGRISPSLPFAHKVSVELLKRVYPSKTAAKVDLPEAFREFYRKNYSPVYHSERAQIEAAAETLVGIYDRNVFPDMNVTWGTHPDNLGHQDFPGCFRCHDGQHKSSGGGEITQDCNSCHSLLAIDEENPKILKELSGGM